MTKAIRYTLLSIRDLLISFGPFVLLTVLLLGLAYWWINPMPPKTVVLATGPAQSAYDEIGKKYKAFLAPYGITVNLLPSEGSSANLDLVRSGQAQLGFVQGGSSSSQPQDESAMESLGSLFVEPIWLFYREDAANRLLGKGGTLTALTQLKGWRVNVGTEGSGVPSLMGKLLDSNKIEPDSLTLMHLGQTPATMALLAGQADAIVFASAPESLMVQMLLMTPGIKLMDFVQSEAYSRRFAFLSPVTLPRGVVDLAQDVPPQDVHLVAPTTSLIANNNTHPALLHLFSAAASQLQGNAGWFNKAGDYPSTKRDDLPLAQEAERYIKNGPPLLQRYLPFWASNVVERMWVALGIIIAVLLPLSRILPPLYQFRVRSRVFRWYAQLREIENKVEASHGQAAVPHDELIQALGELESKVEKVNVPLSYADELYSLRSNIHLVRKKLLRN